MYKRAKLKNNISIVFTARNDNYGGDLINRINALIKVLIFFTNKYKSNFELIIVDYNPPVDKKKLYEVLTINNNKHLKIRFIEFPAELHKKFANSEKIKLFEYIGKNIGIRRATGDFILSTNQDIIFSDDFIRYLTYARLNKDKFYRTDRIDVNLNKNAFKLSEKNLLEYCLKNAYLAKTKDGDKILNYFKLSSILAISKNIIYRIINFKSTQHKLLPHHLHTFAAGDFLMMHKNVWNKVGGYDQTKEGNDYLDSYILFVANCFHFTQQIIPFRIFHIDHLMSKLGRPSIKITDTIKNCNLMLKTNKPYKKYNQSWGLKNLNFTELVKNII